jgi:putative flippase GtrA
VPDEGWCVSWVYAVPPWLVFVAVVILMGGGAAAGLVFFRRLMPQSDELTHNDVAGPIIGTVGTILAVVLSFLLVSVWQEYDAAAATVEREASAVSDLYHAAAVFPPPIRTELRGALTKYVNAIVNQEWPAMRSGGHSSDARRASSEIFGIVAHYQPKRAAEQDLQQDAMNLVRVFQDARRERLFANDQGLPAIFWIGNLILAMLTIGFCYLFRVRNLLVHIVMTAVLAVVIGVIFVLIAEFDYPFRGVGQIPPTVWVNLQHSLSDGLTGSD